MHAVNLQRRKVLGKALYASLAGLAASWGLLPANVHAARPDSAFTAKDIESGLVELFGDNGVEDSGDIEIKAPEIAENGAVVPIKVTANVSNPEAMALVVAKNPNPVICSYDLTPEVVPTVSMRIKMGESSDVIALVKANGKIYQSVKEVKVTVGGCGG